MRKKLTIKIDDRRHAGLHSVVGRRRISRFIESLVRPHVIGKDLEAAYRRMAREEARETEALEWAEATIGDVSDETSSSLERRVKCGDLWQTELGGRSGKRPR